MVLFAGVALAIALAAAGGRAVAAQLRHGLRGRLAGLRLLAFEDGDVGGGETAENGAAFLRKGRRVYESLSASLDFHGTIFG
jgi:hypothetical protein